MKTCSVRKPTWPNSFSHSLRSLLHLRILCIWWIPIWNLTLLCLSIYLSIYLWLYSPLLDLGRFFSFLIPYTDGRTPWTGDQPVARPLPAHRTAQTQSKHTQTSMPWEGLDPTIPAFERAETAHAQTEQPLWSAIHRSSTYIFIRFNLKSNFKEWWYHKRADMKWHVYGEYTPRRRRCNS
jgi:hypothetical protein